MAIPVREVAGLARCRPVAPCDMAVSAEKPHSGVGKRGVANPGTRPPATVFPDRRHRFSAFAVFPTQSLR